MLQDLVTVWSPDGERVLRDIADAVDVSDVRDEAVVLRLADGSCIAHVGGVWRPCAPRDIATAPSVHRTVFRHRPSPRVQGAAPKFGDHGRDGAAGEALV